MVKSEKIDTIERLAALMIEEFHDLRGEMADQFERTGERFGRVDKRLEHLEVDNRDIKESLRHVQHDTSEMKNELRAISRAVDKDATTIIRQGGRLKRLEKRRTLVK